METYPASGYAAVDPLHPSSSKAATNGWMASSHHRQSVLVWNNNSRPGEGMGLGFPSTRSSNGVSTYPHASSSLSAFSSTDARHITNQILSTQRSQNAENNNVN